MIAKLPTLDFILCRECLEEGFPIVLIEVDEESGTLGPKQLLQDFSVVLGYLLLNQLDFGGILGLGR